MGLEAPFQLSPGSSALPELCCRTWLWTRHILVLGWRPSFTSDLPSNCWIWPWPSFLASDLITTNFLDVLDSHLTLAASTGFGQPTLYCGTGLVRPQPFSEMSSPLGVARLCSAFTETHSSVDTILRTCIWVYIHTPLFHQILTCVSLPWKHWIQCFSWVL